LDQAGDSAKTAFVQGLTGKNAAHTAGAHVYQVLT